MGGLRPHLRDAAPQVLSAQAAVEKADTDVKAARGASLPQVSAGGGASRAGAQSEGEWSTASGFDVGLSAQQDLFTGFRNRAQTARNRALLSASEQAALRVIADVSYALRGAFTRLLFAQQYVTLSDVIAGRRQENVNLVELRFDAGREHKGSVLRSKAYKHQADFEMSQAVRATTVARRELATALGGGVAVASLAITGAWAIVSPPAPPDFARMIDSIPDHRQALAQLQAAREEVRVTDSSFYPQWNAGASLGRQSDQWPPADDQWNLNTSVSVPLFAGGQNWYAARGARAGRRQAEAQLTDIDNQLVFSLEDMFRAWVDAVERVGVQDEFLRAAEVRSEIARSQYSNGLITFDDWDLIENDLIDKQRLMLTSRRDAVLAQAAWDRLCGISAIP